MTPDEMSDTVFLRALRISGPFSEDTYLNALPVVRALADGEPLRFHAPVTFFVGENGTGKSTLLEALAVAWGFNPEGGSRNFQFSTASTHSELCRHVKLIRGPYRAKDGYFLRAESFYNAASYLQDIDGGPGPSIWKSYGGRPLHEQSHGESFMALLNSRFGGQGFYLLDEPEAALSPTRQMSLLARIYQLAREGSQFIVATHSPILIACPGAEVYVLDDKGLTSTDYRETEHYLITRQFLDQPDRMLKYLLEDS